MELNFSLKGDLVKQLLPGREFAMYIREQVISGALLTETRSMSYVDLAERALPSGLVAVRH